MRSGIEGISVFRKLKIEGGAVNVLVGKGDGALDPIGNADGEGKTKPPNCACLAPLSAATNPKTAGSI